MTDDNDLVNTNVIDFRTAAQLRTSTQSDEDPDQAARALDQEKAYGVPAQTIMGDPEGYDAMFKKTLGNRIIAKNAHLQDFINAHPVHGALVHDDLGSLDKLSQSYRALLANPLKDAIDAFNQQFPAGRPGRLGLGGTLTQAPEPEEPQDVEFAKNHPTLYAYLNPLAYLMGVPARAISGAFAATEAGGTSFLKGTGMSDQAATQTMRQLLSVAEAEMSRQMGEVGKIGPREYGQRLMEQRPEVAKAIPPLNEVVKDAEPFIGSGKEPPVGVRPEFDEYHRQRAKLDADAIDDVLKSVQQTALRDRSPDALEQFINIHGEHTIGISADAVRQLYGGAVPTATDNKLGFIPGLARQLANAEQFGGDIEVPLSTYLSKVEPEIAKALSDFIRVRPGGMTIAESKEPIIAYHATPAEFEQFDLTHMGTGEGAQSFGPGHYFAGNEKVGQNYLKQFSLQMMSDEERQAARILDANEGDREAALASLQQEIASTKSTLRAQTLDRVRQILQRNEKLPEANFLKVALDVDPNFMLDHDKPLSEQSPEVQKILSNLDIKPSNEQAIAANQALIERYKEQLTQRTGPQRVATEKLIERLEGEIKEYKQVSVAQALEEIRDRGASPAAKADETAQERRWRQLPTKLSKAGLHGIRYLDQGSRGLEEPEEATHNLVVFDDNRIKITHRNGKAVTPEEGETLKREVLQRDVRGRPMRTAPLGATEDKVMRTARAYQRVAATRAMEEESGFTTTALSRAMTADMFRRYQDLITKEINDDVAKQMKRQAELARREKTKQWKDLKATLEPQVAEEVRNRPEVLAARILRTKQGQAANPDVLARVFGYATGDEMMQANAAFEKARGKVEPQNFERQLIKEELGRQLDSKFGDLPAEIIREAKEHVLIPTVMDRIAEEVHALGMQAGGQTPISKADLRTWVKQAMASMPWQAIDSDKLMAAAGKNGRAAEAEQLKKNFQNAFIFKQRQQKALELARQALDFEQLKSTFARNMARYAKREGPAAVDSHFTHQIQSILQRMGLRVERNPRDLADQIDRDKTGPLTKFAADQAARGLPLDVADFLLDPNFTKKIDQLSAHEYGGLATTIKIMDKMGRDAERQTDQMANIATAVVINQMEPKIGRFSKIPFKFGEEGWTSKFGDTLSSMLWTETLLRHFDHYDNYGPFQRYIVQPMARAINQFTAWEKEFGARYREVGKIKDPDKAIDNPWIKDLDGNPIPMTRADLLGVISHWGNESNRDKFLKGWGIISKEGKMEDWIVRQEFERWMVENSKPEDWRRQESIGKIFTKIFNDISKPVYHRLTGDTPEALDLQPFDNDHGSFEGWYHPLDYIDELNLRPKQATRSVGLLSPDFKAQLPANQYAHSRTGYYGRVEINSNLVPARLRQMLYDGALREAVVDVNKLFQHPSFRKLVTDHYGSSAIKGLDDWLDYVVNGANLNERSLKGAIQAGKYFRENVVSSYVSFNLGTIMKHGPTAAVFSARRIGTGTFAKEFLRPLYDPRTYARDNDFMMQSSLEMQRRQRTFQDTLGSVHSALEGDLGTLMKARDYWNYLGSYGVAWSDWLSSSAMWKGRYKQAFEETKGDHEQAVAQADAAVRQTHGSTAPTVLPPMVRNAGEMAKWGLSLFTFFNTRYQRQAETVWKTKEAWGLGRNGEFKQALKMAPEIIGDLASYTMFPIVWDTLVTGSKFSLAGIALGSVAASIPIVRDIYHAVAEGTDPELGLLSSSIKDLYNMTKRYMGNTKQSAGQMLSDFLTLSGNILGVGGRAFSRPLQYATDLFTGNQKPPETPGQVYRGVRFGKEEERKK